MPMLPTLLFLATMQGSTPPSLTAPEILERMVRADSDRAAALAGYALRVAEDAMSGLTADTGEGMRFTP